VVERDDANEYAFDLKILARVAKLRIGRGAEWSREDGE